MKGEEREGKGGERGGRGTDGSCKLKETKEIYREQRRKVEVKTEGRRKKKEEKRLCKRTQPLPSSCKVKRRST